MRQDKKDNPSNKEAIYPKRILLEKVISYKNYISLGFGAIIGMGWIVYTGEWLTKGGPLGSILGFICGGLLLISIGKIYAELTPALPVAGGEIAFSYKAFGPGTAFLSAWLLGLAYIVICPFETVAIGWLLEYIIPAIKTGTLYQIGGYSVHISSIVSGIIITVIIMVFNIRGVKNSARLQMAATGIMLLCFVSFTVVALLKGNISNLFPLFSGEGNVWAVLPSSILSVLVVVPFWLSGFDTIPQAAEESGNKVLPNELGKAIVVSILMGIMFYVLIILAVSLSLPWREITKVDKSLMPTAEVFRIAFGYEWAVKLVLLTAFFGLVTSFNGFFLASSRVIFAAGRGGLLPNWFGKVHPRFHTPVNAVLFVGIFAFIGPFLGKASFAPIVHVGSFAFISAWFITAISAIKLRKTAPWMKRPYKIKRKSTLYVGGGVSLILILFFIIPGSPEQLSWPLEYIISGGWLIIGLIFYLWRRGKKDMTKEEMDYQILGDYR